MKFITIFAAICFLLVAINQGVALVGSIIDERAINVTDFYSIYWLISRVLAVLADVSASTFFFVLFTKQLKNRRK